MPKLVAVARASDRLDRESHMAARLCAKTSPRIALIKHGGIVLTVGDLTRPGAYGLHLPTLASAGSLLVDAPDRWCDWHIELAAGAGRPREFLDDARARLVCEPSGWVDIDRAARTSRMHLPGAPTLPEIAQPRLGITGIVAAYWRGDHSFHAGAFVAGGMAWGILGSKGAGKSSLLAMLASMGVPVLADDVLIVNGRLDVLAGPRCIDLRREAALALGLGESIGVLGTRERWRMHLRPAPCEVPLGGFVCLEWGSPAVSHVPPNDRVRTLYANLALLLGEQRDPAALSTLMELLALPMVRIRRPREIERIGETADLLLGTISGLERPPVQSA
jgi:hypothetical protein